MSLVTKIIGALKKRLLCLLKEISILDQQIPYCASVPGFINNYAHLFTNIRNLRATTCDLLTTYIEEFEKHSTPEMNIKKIISTHLLCMKSHVFEILSIEMLGHQSSVITLIGKEYEKITKDYDETTDAQLRMIYLNFPYDFVFKLFRDKSFLTLLLQCCEAYNPRAHSSFVVALFEEIKKFYEMHKDESRKLYFTADGPLFFSLAEHFIGLFNYETMFDAQIEKIADFQVLEKCVMIVKHGPESCGLNENILKHLLDLNIEINPEHFMRETIKEIPARDEENVPIPSLHYIVYELRKIQLQCSASEMLHCLSNALQWISDTMTSGGQAAGADEIFQFFVFLLTVANISNIQTLINYMEAYVDEGLRETKYPFLISQMRMALEFIDGRMIPVEPFLIFPFKTPPERLKDALKLASEDKIILRGFSLYAFPTWTPECETVFPAMLYYSGSDLDSAAVYKFTVSDGSKLFTKGEDIFESFATLNGTFFQMPEDYQTKKKIISVSDGDYELSKDVISCISTMILMKENLFKNPCTNDVLAVGSKVLTDWGGDISDPVLSITIFVAEVQRALIILGYLPERFQVDGVFTQPLIDAIKKFTNQKKNSAFEFTYKTYQLIISKSHI